MNRLLLRAYPPSFRDRYGAEIAALMEDAGDRGLRTTIDLLTGIARAWCAPSFAGNPKEQQRARLQSTVTTAVVAWAMSLIAVAAYGRAVNDPPLFRNGSVASTFFHASSVIMGGLTIAALAVGFVYWLAVVVPALRSRRRDILVPALAPAAFVGIWGMVTVLAALVVPHVVTTPFRPSPVLAIALWTAFFAYAALSALCVFGCVVSVSRAVRTAKLPVHILRPGAMIAAAGSLTLFVETVLTTACLVLVLRSQTTIAPSGAELAWGVAQAVVPLILLAIATVSVSVSSTRGVRALRTPVG